MVAKIEIVSFMPEHLGGAVRLSEQVNWPHRKEDWALMLDISEGVVALCNGQIVGTALTTLFGTDAAASNMIIVDAAIQKQGLGRRLMDDIMLKAHGRENRLVATDVGLPLYTKLDFKVTGRITQHQGILGKVTFTDDRCEWDDAPDVEALCTLDHMASGLDRRRLIHALMNVGKVVVIRDGGSITGFAVLRDFGRGQVVGPVVCENVDEAKSLLQFAFATQQDTFMRVDIPEESGLYDWLSHFGMAHVGKHVRMTLNSSLVKQDTSVQTFALVSQALG